MMMGCEGKGKKKMKIDMRSEEGLLLLGRRG